MSKKLYEIISRVLNTPITEINDDSSAETLTEWDSFNLYVMLDEIENKFNVKFSLEETLQIKNVGDFKKNLEKYGVNLNE